MNSVTLAVSSNLVGSYHDMFDGLLNSAAGQIITKICAAAAVLLALGLIIGGIFKALGRSNKLVTMFCPDLKRIVVVLVVTFILAGPIVTFPFMLTILDYFVNAVGQQGTDYLGV